MKALVRILKIFIIITGWVFFSLLIIPFIFCPVYDFPAPSPFSGDNLWNPYQNMDSTLWWKANFQVQSDAWAGITSGRENPSQKIYELYKYLEYDIITISDYMKINDYGKNAPPYIPVYEHGYNLFKVHQVCIGANKVCWFDYPLFQTKHNKQFIINLLRDNDLVALAHPAFVPYSYSTNDMKYLCNYDCIEAMNHLKYSFSHWDSALSAGHPVFLLSDDDEHDISNP
ncbi:MAG: hypothetical protein HY738_23655, partial [Bacteroidia bacterium]|nr:hypothetical protein [Bacteroidia bacterium]